MTGFDQLALSGFIGSDTFYKIGRRFLLTEGTKYLADNAQCYWLMDAVSSHLMEIGTADWFVAVRVVVANQAATMVYGDGNGHEHARQQIPYTDFPLGELTLYACWDGEHWVIMLPSEY